MSLGPVGAKVQAGRGDGWLSRLTVVISVYAVSGKVL